MPDVSPSQLVTDDWPAKFVPRVVAIHEGGDDFRSESSDLVKVTTFRSEPSSLPSESPSRPQPSPSLNPPSSPAREINWRNNLLAFLAFAVVAQTGLLAYWGVSGRAMPWAAPSTGTVTINSEPSGSPVSIDGAERGHTPLTLSLEAGTYSITVGTGEQSRTQRVNVTRGGDASVHLQLPASSAAAVVSTASLQIATEPAGARVWVDGEPRGVSPLTVGDLDAGEHAITVRGNSGNPIHRTVMIQEGSASSLVITMPATPALSSGWLTISSPIALQVMENGALLGTTDMSRIMLPAGEHQLELVNTPLNVRLPRTVTIASGRTVPLAILPPRGAISINALPWAEVWINGQRIGETPIGNYSLPVGVHEILFRHPELGEQRKTVTVGAQGAARIGVDMKKP